MLQKCLKDLNTFGGAQATIFPTLQKNSWFSKKIPDFKTWKKDKDKFPTSSRFFNTVGALD